MVEPSEHARQLVHLFEQMRGKRNDRAFARLNELQLSFSHLHALRLLAASPSLAMKDLAGQLCLTPPSVTALTRRLVQTGLVQRQTHTGDSRVTLLSLTEAGRALLQDLYRGQIAQMERLLGGLSSDEQALFLRLMQQAVEYLRTHPDQGSGVGGQGSGDGIGGQESGDGG